MRQEGNLRGHVHVVDVLVVVAVLVHARAEGRHEDDDQNQYQGGQGSPVVAQADGRVLEKADGLRLEPGVLQFTIQLEQFKVVVQEGPGGRAVHRPVSHACHLPSARGGR